ncbi:MAG: glycosyltransferase, partial [Romboutsia sp.]|uniref:glycosyltransferase n=1 Tax=Romboutsia sp. TaxID=1965302 RepID=UPI003F3D0308
SDRTYDIAKKYENKYKEKIKVLKNEKNLTLGPTLNKCIKETTGRYIARQDADDISRKDRIEKQVAFLEQNSNIHLVGSEMYVVDNGEIQGTRKMKRNPQAKDMIKGSVFAHATVMLRREIYIELKGYSVEKNRKGVEDYDLWFRFFKHQFRGENLQEPLYYVTENSDAYKRKDIRRRFREVLTLVDGIKMLRLDKKNYIYVIKPLITIIIPKSILKKYHERGRKLSK